MRAIQGADNPMRGEESRTAASVPADPIETIQRVLGDCWERLNRFDDPDLGDQIQLARNALGEIQQGRAAKPRGLTVEDFSTSQRNAFLDGWEDGAGGNHPAEPTGIVAEEYGTPAAYVAGYSAGRSARNAVRGVLDSRRAKTERIEPSSGGSREAGAAEDAEEELCECGHSRIRHHQDGACRFLDKTRLGGIRCPCTGFTSEKGAADV